MTLTTTSHYNEGVNRPPTGWRTVMDTCTRCSHQAPEVAAFFVNADTGASERWCDECWGSELIYVCDCCERGLPPEAFPDGYADGVTDVCTECWDKNQEGCVTWS